MTWLKTPKTGIHALMALSNQTSCYNIKCIRISNQMLGYIFMCIRMQNKWHVRIKVRSKQLCISLTTCMQLNFACSYVICWFFSSKITFSKNYFRNTIRVSNSLDPYQVPTFNRLWSVSKIICKGHQQMMKKLMSKHRVEQVNFPLLHIGIDATKPVFGARLNPVFSAT